MEQRTVSSTSGRISLHVAGLAAALALSATACSSGVVTSGAAVGRVGEELSSHASSVPRGGEVCAIKDALAAQPGAADKPVSEACAKQATNDHLWRRSMVVLGAYGETIDTIASGNGSETTGQLEAARTGIKGKDWIQVEGATEEAARDAAAKLVKQMSATGEKDDLEKAILDAAPHVKTLCDGLDAYLDEQAKGLNEAHADLDKRRAARSDRRCTTMDGKTICVGESASDRVVFAHAAGQLSVLELNHLEARDSVSGFCAGHKKLEEAAKKGDLDSDATFAAVLDAVKASRSAQAVKNSAPAASPEPTDSKPDKKQDTKPAGPPAVSQK
jgi:hypothetical protein